MTTFVLDKEDYGTTASGPRGMRRQVVALAQEL